MYGRKKVLIIEDDEYLQKSIQLIIDSSSDFKVIGTYAAFEDAAKKIPKDFPDLIFMDIQLPGVNGIEATRVIKEKYNFIQVVILTAFDDDELVFEALKAGAVGYITKGLNYVELLNALGEITRGGAPMSSKIARMVVEHFRVNLNSPLSARERTVLTKLAAGKTYTQIAEDLFIAPETAKTHIRNIYQKLHVNSKAEAIEKATQQKLI